MDDLFFRIIAFLFLGVSLSFFLITVRNKKLTFSCTFAEFKKVLLQDKSNSQAEKSSRRVNNLPSSIFIFTALLFTILFLSGYIPQILFGQKMTGIFLLLHVTAAPIFCISAALLIFFTAHYHRFNEKDPVSPESKIIVIKFFFWLGILLLLILMLSIILTFFPLFGTAGTNFLVDVHRYSALLFTVDIIFYTYFLLNLKKKIK